MDLIIDKRTADNIIRCNEKFFIDKKNMFYMERSNFYIIELNYRYLDCLRDENYELIISSRNVTDENEKSRYNPEFETKEQYNTWINNLFEYMKDVLVVRGYKNIRITNTYYDETEENDDLHGKILIVRIDQ